MKRFLFILVLLVTVQASYCQSGEVYISVAMPQDCILDSNTKTILKNKLLMAAAARGVASTECGAIAFVPDITILDENKVEGGMRTIYTYQINMTVTACNTMTNTVFNSIQLTCNGEGYSKMDASRSAINKLNLNTDIYNKFVEETKSKVIEYYKKNTSTIIAKAKTLASQQAYDEALAWLSTYPESLSGYQQVATTIKDIFTQSQTKYCNEILQAARAAYAKRDFIEAADIAASINPQSNCADEAKLLLARIKRDSDKEYNDKLATERELHRDQVALEREHMQSQERMHSASMDAARDIAKSYYQRQTRYIYFW